MASNDELACWELKALGGGAENPVNQRGGQSQLRVHMTMVVPERRRRSSQAGNRSRGDRVFGVERLGNQEQLHEASLAVAYHSSAMWRAIRVGSKRLNTWARPRAPIARACSGRSCSRSRAWARACESRRGTR